MYIDVVIRLKQQSVTNLYTGISKTTVNSGRFPIGKICAEGESIISYADYAAALVEEIAKGGDAHKRISVVRA